MSFKIKISELPSLEKAPSITTSIKDNPYKANAEIEKDEYVLRPDMGAIYKAVGKTHKQGGIETYLPEGSFVFSDDPSLHFKKGDFDMMELKSPYSSVKKDNTPAQVLKKNIEIKHYNKMTSILDDKKATEFHKRTAAMMLNKYEDVAGRVAYMQEEKKDFPDGVPEFAEGTAPVYDNNVKNNVMEQKQYMKEGGYFQTGGGKYPTWLKAWRKANTEQGRISPTGKSTTYERTDQQLQEDYNYWKGLAGRQFKDASDYQGFLYDYNLQKDPGSVATMWNTWGQTNGMGDKPIIGKENIYESLSGAPNEEFLSRPDVRRNFLDKPKNPYLGVRSMYLGSQRYPTPVEPPATVHELPPFIGAPAVRKKPDQVPVPPTIDVPEGKNQNIGWDFNPWQKMNMGWDALNAASVRQEFPYRSQVSSPLVELERVNPQASLNNADNAAFKGSQNLRGMNPYLAMGQNASIYGQNLDAKQQIQSQYDNQNVGIGNEQNIRNNATQQGDQRFNVQADQQYYRESVEGRKNFQNLKQASWNNFRNNLNSNVEQNQSLAYGMAAHPNSPYGYDFKTGQFYSTGKDILAANNVFGKPNYISNEVLELAEKYKLAGATPDVAIREASRLMGMGKLASMYPSGNSYQKKGGTINPYRKKK